MRAWWLTLAVCGCIDTNSVVCDDGELCPGNSVCTPLTHITNDPNAELCATPDQLAACANKQDNDLCGTGGACHDGVCLPIACGNGYVDPGEACDDHNNASGDGCSADCMSNETCGNGVRDGITFEECDDGNLVDNDGCDSSCRTEHAQWHDLSIDQIPTRSTPMVFDQARGEAVVFGGLVGGTFPLTLSDTWLWSGRGWLKATPQTSPSARERIAVAYDAAHHRTVMFGGAPLATPQSFPETWLWDGHEWSLAHPTTLPLGRDGTMLAFDGKRGRVIMFGGHQRTIEGGNAYLTDTWSWDGSNWTELHPTTVPDGRMNGAMSYDPLRDQIVLFGGTNAIDQIGNVPLKTWTFDGSEWHAIAGTQPPARFKPAMAWDAVTHTSVLFGGNTNAGATANDRADTWAWNGAAWTKLIPTTIPPARSDFGLASDPADGVIIMWGGSGTDARTWQWNGTTWKDVSPVTVPAQLFTQSAYDQQRGRTIVLDDYSSPAVTYEFDGGWRRSPATTLVPNVPGLAYDAARQQTVAFGGALVGVDTNDTWTSNGTSWTKASPATSPTIRYQPVLAYDSARKRTVLFGGFDSNLGVELADTWEWDGSTWQQLAPATAPSAREQFSIAYDPIRHNTVLFGGFDDTSTIADTWLWDGTVWQQAAMATPSPSERRSPEFVWDARRRSIVMFSSSSPDAQSDVWEWNGAAWSEPDIDGTPPGPRGSAAMMIARDGSLVMFSGNESQTVPNNESWQLTWENNFPSETCVTPIDLDGDGLAGCADPDCYAVCNPTCTPGVACDATAPHCGDGVCNSDLETCRMCPEDCGACPAVCGDSFCDPGETPASCPGDCH
jgi:cysteine-rich repeat protein